MRSFFQKIKYGHRNIQLKYFFSFKNQKYLVLEKKESLLQHSNISQSKMCNNESDREFAEASTAAIHDSSISRTLSESVANNEDISLLSDLEGGSG